jgi:hypothetical protein
MKTAPAFASAPASGKTVSPVFSLIQTLCVLGVLIWAALLKRELASTKKDLAALRERPAVAESAARETAALRERVATLESQLAAAASLAMESKPVAAPAPAPTPAAAPASPMSAIAAMANNPAMRNLMAASQKRIIENRYTELFALLQFSPEQRSGFVDMMAEVQASQTDIGLKVLSGNLSAQEQESLKQQVANAEASTEQKVREFFGDEAKFATFKQYNEQQSERTQVNALRTSLAQTGQQPLSTDQASALTEIMYTERKNFRFTPSGDPANPIAAPSAEAVETRVRDQEMLNNRIAERAAAVLSPEQLANLRRNQAQRQEAIKASSETVRQLLGGALAAPK